jgi:hypothetical protein
MTPARFLHPHNRETVDSGPDEKLVFYCAERAEREFR